MSYSYDVVVVGAGPAGLSAAAAAARKGVKTLLIDNRAEIGDHNHCGELLPSPNEIKGLLPRASGADKLVDVPSRLIMAQTKTLRFISPSGKTHEFPFESNIIDRRGFEKQLAIEASRYGADVMPSTKAIGIAEDRHGIVVISRGEKIELHSPITIGCDGIGSRIAKWAGLGNNMSPRDCIIGVQFEMSRVKVERDIVEMYFGTNVAPGGYAWIIPKGDDVANVGLGIRTTFSEKGVSVKEYLHRFIKFNRVASIKVSMGTTVAFRKGVIPVGGPIDRTYTENVLVAGDAGGFTMAANGGGMPPGLVTGKIAGEAAADYLNKLTDISQYEKEWRHQIGKELNTALEIRRLMDRAMDSDSKMESTMNRLGPKYMGELIRCRLPRILRIGAKVIGV